MRLLLIFCCSLAFSVYAHELRWLRPTELELANFPAPPSPESAQDQQDLQEVLRLQSVRSQAECQRALDEASGTLVAFFGAPYGPLSPSQVEKLGPFFDSLWEETNYFVHELKVRWMRPRPYLRDIRVQACIPGHASTSYPSGHAAVALVTAGVLAQLFPELASELLERGKTIGVDRVLGGVHYPQDVQAGQDLGGLILKALEQNKLFQADLHGLEAETSPTAAISSKL